ncbi:MAG: M1 family aminopeptidase [Bacteroidota bacterium]|nr:M1 family aminopeptidase [Bacteroidota bacterium]
MRIYFKVLCFLIVFVNANILAQNTHVGCQYGKNLQSSTPIYYSAENLRSDTFDILKYTINLEIGNTVTKLIKGNTQIRFAPKQNNRTFILFDLLKLTIDSVKENASLLTYVYNDTILKVNFLAPKNIIDTAIITVYYNGQPQGDPSGWGGFYFNNTGGAQYAYNLGVGFGAKPHNYGRVWFPCFDNFVERSKYEFNITNDSIRKAYCNGQLISDVVTMDKRTRKWVLNEEIPTYLANVAVANYKQVNWSILALDGLKPITLVGVANDTTPMKNAFVNLKNCINGFENYFGPYKWNRFGYCLVPFNSGAMEHATNISYPRATIGNLTYEADLMAHELSHHWWGDLITCETQEDMWINEGMATFSSYMFLEWKYGKASYLNALKTEHDKLLQFLHKKEGGFRAISGIPHSLTYGDHVYKKGADVAHTLRSYMGDLAFFNGAKYVMQQNANKSLNSIEFRNLLQTSSGQNLTDFFNNWVLTGGWSHFAIDSVKYIQISPTSYNAVVSLKQKTLGTTILHDNVPLEISFFKNDWSAVTKTVTMSGATGIFTVNIPFNPVYSALNYDSKIGDATSHEIKTMKTVNNFNWPLGKIFMLVKNKGLDSSLIRVVHNYVKPDAFKNNPANHKLSNQQFWKIEGILSPGFHAKARFNYDGNKTIGGTYSYMDTLLTIVNGDSLRLFYRADAADDWKVVKHMSKLIFGTRVGYIEVDTLKLGEYTFGNSTDTSSVGIKEIVKNSVAVNVFPNPAKQKLTIEFKEELTEEHSLNIINLEGKSILSMRIDSKKSILDLSQFAKATYLIRIEKEGQTVFSQKLILD